MSKNKNIKFTYIKEHGIGSVLHARTAGDTCPGKGCVAPGLKHTLTTTRYPSV
jgi:hypothetical protein